MVIFDNLKYIFCLLSFKCRYTQIPVQFNSSTKVKTINVCL